MCRPGGAIAKSRRAIWSRLRNEKDDDNQTAGVGQGIVKQSRIAIENMPKIVTDVGYGPQDIMRVGVWLDDARDFWSFNDVFESCFADHPPARACVQSAMVVDCKVEVDCIAYRKPA
ncbi:RidA family protein [Paracoccus sp. (in: a-proteobacteria)]|uniref:RidA family protein n=1 Tax=Paracoccus sp. TaxID=267 RepID=UPI0039E2808B